MLMASFKTASGGFLSRGTKFSPLDVKRTYFGNWLRDCELTNPYYHSQVLVLTM
jgi:hypothetical protein